MKTGRKGKKNLIKKSVFSFKILNHCHKIVIKGLEEI